MRTLRSVYEVSVEYWGNEYDNLQYDSKEIILTLTHENLTRLLQLIQAKKLTYFNVYKEETGGIYIGRVSRIDNLKEVDTIHGYVIESIQTELGTKGVTKVERFIYKTLKGMYSKQ